MAMQNVYYPSPVPLRTNIGSVPSLVGAAREYRMHRLFYLELRAQPERRSMGH